MTRVGSLCSGFGGLELGMLSVIDATVAWHCENDPAAAKVLAHHYPGIPNHGDLTAVDWATVELVDVLCAGFPCQPISQAGRRKVTADARWLWPAIAHAVRVLRPRLVCLENVPPLLRPWLDDDGWWNPAPIEEVAGDLAALRYDLRWTCVRASDVGAPHRRERVFIVGVARNAHDERRQGSLAKPRRHALGAHRPATDTVRPGAGRDGRPVPRAPGEGRRPGLDLYAPVDAREATADTNLSIGEARDVDRSGNGFKRRCESVDRGPADWGTYAHAIARWEHLTGRLAPAPIDEHTRLSPAFSEWMLGLPAGWVTAVPGVSRTAQLHVIGNGVVPQAAAAAFTDLLNIGEAA